MANSTPISSGVPEDSATPIFKLDSDILWKIFSLNADMEQETESDIPALLTLRRMSQVCFNWRVVVLGLPSLWARVINLQSLNRAREEWRTEVIQRTGTALLHIKALDASDQAILAWDDWEFFGQILDHHWTRIQSLHFELEIYQIINKFRHLFERPAPFIEVFKHSNTYEIPCRSNFVLFANKAPLLRTLSAPTLTQNVVTLSAPHLRHLVLHTSVSAIDLLGALSRMPFLERLEATNLSDSPPTPQAVNVQSHLPRLTLPQLTYIMFEVNAGVDDAVSLLAHITPASGCILKFAGAYASTNHHRNTHRSDILSTYPQANPDFATANNLIVHFSTSDLGLRVSVGSDAQFEFNIHSRTGFPDHVIFDFLHSIAALRFDNVKRLEIFIRPEQIITSNPDFLLFMFRLPLVETLKAFPPVLESIRNVQSDNVVLAIPSLRCIHCHYVRSSEVPLVLDFLQSRIAIGAPVDKIILNKDSRVDTMPLESLPGLTVEVSGR